MLGCVSLLLLMKYSVCESSAFVRLMFALETINQFLGPESPSWPSEWECATVMELRPPSGALAAFWFSLLERLLQPESSSVTPAASVRRGGGAGGVWECFPDVFIGQWLFCKS